MQFLDDPLVLMIAFVIVVMIVTIASFSILGKAGKRTLQTYGKGRTASEKMIYMFATVGILTILIVTVFVTAWTGYLTIPIIDMKFTLDFVVENVYYVGAIVFGIGLLVIYSMIWAHQRSTNMGEVIRKGLKGETE